MPSLDRRAPRILGVRTVGALVIRADHLHRPASRQVIQREIDGRAPVVFRSLRRIGHQPPLGRGRRIPEDLRHVPGSVRVVDEQPVA